MDDQEGNKSFFNFFGLLLLLLTCSSHLCIALTARLEAANKALAKDQVSRQVSDQALQATQETNSALTRDLQVVRASTATLKEDLEAARGSAAAANQELSSKSAAFDELVLQERDA
jgi:uncharacterized membrane protein YccC